MTRLRSMQHDTFALLLFASVGTLPACSARALVLDGASSTWTSTADAAVETLTLPEEAAVFGVDEARLYWANSSQDLSPEWRSCLHDDCEHTAVSYGSGLVFVWSDHDVFWLAQPHTVMSCPKTGCRGAPTSVVTDPYVGGLVGDGDSVYWSSAFDTYRCPRSGCGDFPETVARGDAGFGLQIVGPRAYWWRPTDAANDATSPSEIRSAPKDGSEPATTVRTVPSVREFVVDATTLFWIDDTNQVLSCPLANCSDQPAATLATSDHFKHSLSVDAAGLYWAEPGASQFDIQFCPLTGCGSEPRTLLADTGLYFALDSTYVYFLGVASDVSGDFRGSRIIRRIQKPTP